MAERYKLERFVTAQDADGTYDLAISELRAGHKTGHWMWFIFPQIDGLGHSQTARMYAISTLREAQEYLRHPLLGPRLLACAGAVAGVRGRNVQQIFGTTDAQKLCSSMTLFLRAAAGEGAPGLGASLGDVFEQVLALYFDGSPDSATDQRLEAESLGTDTR